jgi:hypothetical protein
VTAEPAPGREYFTRPSQPNQRRYEALRAYFTEDLTAAEAAIPWWHNHRLRFQFS